MLATAIRTKPGYHHQGWGSIGSWGTHPFDLFAANRGGVGPEMGGSGRSFAEGSQDACPD